MSLAATGSCGAASLRYGGTTPPLTMDPHATNDFVTAGIVRQTYDLLVGLDNAMELEPGVATAWAPVDPSTWRFTIWQGVTFHDGSPMTAEDVAFSIMRQKEAPLYKALYGGIKSATVVNPTTVDMVSATPDPILPRKMVRLFVMSQKWAAANGVERCRTWARRGNGSLHASPRQWHRPDEARVAGAEPEDRLLRAQQVLVGNLQRQCRPGDLFADRLGADARLGAAVEGAGPDHRSAAAGH